MLSVHVHAHRSACRKILWRHIRKFRIRIRLVICPCPSITFEFAFTLVKSPPEWMNQDAQYTHCLLFCSESCLFLLMHTFISYILRFILRLMFVYFKQQMLCEAHLLFFMHTRFCFIIIFTRRLFCIIPK